MGWIQAANWHGMKLSCMHSVAASGRSAATVPATPFAAQAPCHHSRYTQPFSSSIARALHLRQRKVELSAGYALPPAQRQHLLPRDAVHLVLWVGGPHLEAVQGGDGKIMPYAVNMLHDGARCPIQP